MKEREGRIMTDSEIVSIRLKIIEAVIESGLVDCDNMSDVVKQAEIMEKYVLGVEGSKHTLPHNFLERK